MVVLVGYLSQISFCGLIIIRDKKELIPAPNISMKLRNSLITSTPWML